MNEYKIELVLTEDEVEELFSYNHIYNVASACGMKEPTIHDQLGIKIIDLIKEKLDNHTWRALK